MKPYRIKLLFITLMLVLGGVGISMGCRRRERTTPIRISGAWALYPAMVRWAEVYKQEHPAVRLDITAGGAGKGLTDCMAGLVDLGMVSRDLRPEELSQGITLLPVAKDAVFAVVNVNNPAASALQHRGLSQHALRDLWLKGKRTDWEHLAPGGGSGEVHVYTRSDACGAAETWAHFLGKQQEDLEGVAVYGDPGLGEAVRRDVLGIGYNNLNFAFDVRTGLPLKGLLLVPLDVNDNGVVDASEDISTLTKALSAIRSGAYPAPPARDLFLAVRKPISPVVRQFLIWILNEGQKMAPEAGYIPISETQRASALAMVGP